MTGGRAVGLPSGVLGALAERPSLASIPPLRVAEMSRWTRWMSLWNRLAVPPLEPLGRHRLDSPRTGTEGMGYSRRLLLYRRKMKGLTLGCVVMISNREL